MLFNIFYDVLCNTTMCVCYNMAYERWAYGTRTCNTCNQYNYIGYLTLPVDSRDVKVFTLLYYLIFFFYMILYMGLQEL
jgi:hypothetical protein